jgi:hypothetical protein
MSPVCLWCVVARVLQFGGSGEIGCCMLRSLALLEHMELVPTWSPVGPQLVPSWSPVGPQLVPSLPLCSSVHNNWCLSPVGPSWSPVVPQSVPCLSPVCHQYVPSLSPVCVCVRRSACTKVGYPVNSAQWTFGLKSIAIRPEYSARPWDFGPSRIPYAEFSWHFGLSSSGYSTVSTLA